MAHRSVATGAVNQPVGDIRRSDRAGIENLGQFPDQSSRLRLNARKSMGFAREDNLGRAILRLKYTGRRCREFVSFPTRDFPDDFSRPGIKGEQETFRTFLVV